MRSFLGRFLAFGAVAWAIVHLPCARAQDLSAGSWRLLIDQTAAWETDELFLPEDVNLQTLPINPPTGGWAALNNTAGIAVTLPSTVEEHYWGQFGSRPYAQGNEDRWALQDPYYFNGNYLGVSWWYRTFSAPPVPASSRVLLHVEASRLRTEVYVNGKLCAYSILPELPIEADITAALRPGTANQLAIRITNAGGRWDWRDWWPFNWGSYVIPSSLGASGLASGVTLQVVNATRVSDLAVLNQPEPHAIVLYADVTNQSGNAFTGEVVFTVKDATGLVVQTAATPATVPAGGTGTFTAAMTAPVIALWTLEAPTLYTATAELRGVRNSTAKRPFGFRSFEAVGIGTDARFHFNQQRIVIRSAISWGFWAPNGIWATPETEQRELTTAKAMGLNCLQSHRELSNTFTLDAQDAAGLLRYEEPGAGIATLGESPGPYNAGPNNAIGVTDFSGDNGEPGTFTEKYEEDRILAMVRRDRSHPSVIMYCVQNELNPDLRNPRIYNLLRKIHAIDPSRIVVLKSGTVQADQAFMLPYDDTVHIDDGTGYSGWVDVHTTGGPGTWSRSLYSSPESFSHLSDIKKQIMVWGEMLGAGTPDDNRRIVADYAATGTSGYDRDDRALLDAAYSRFLLHYGFETAFPTTSALYNSISDKSYYEWQRMLENTRICDNIDYIVVSGWESTTVENHSGLLDAHRVPKADPAILGQANAPVMLVVRPRRFVLSTAQPVKVDVFLVNEAGLQGPAQLTLTATGPTGRALFSQTTSVNITGGEVFGQLLHENFSVPGAALPGNVTLTGTLAPAAALPAGVTSANLTRSETLLVIAPSAGTFPQRTVLVDSSGAIGAAFSHFYGAPFLPPSELSTGKPVDAVVFSVADPNAGDNPALLAAALKQVHENGTRLVIWSDTGSAALTATQMLQDHRILKSNGVVGNARAPWMGSWYFVRDNPIFNGLPVNTALDHRYELPQEGIDENGLLLTAAGMQAYVGYGRDHDPKLGIGLCVIPYGKGRIVLSAIASEVAGLTDSPNALARPIALRLLSNALTQPLP